MLPLIVKQVLNRVGESFEWKESEMVIDGLWKKRCALVKAGLCDHCSW